jgi:hypothetical protein
MLEKGKTNTSAAHAQWAAAVDRAGHSVHLSLLGQTADPACRLVNSAGLFLRNCVLLV